MDKRNNSNKETQVKENNNPNSPNNLHFIKAPCHQSSRKQGFQFAPDEIKKAYDYQFDVKEFSGSKIDFDSGHKIAKGYQELYQYVRTFHGDDPKKKIITIGGDHSISAATIAGINEHYITRNGDNFESGLKILWIDAYPDIHDYQTSENKDLNEMSVASLLGDCEPTFTKHKLLLNHNQFIFYGLQDSEEIDYLNEFEMRYYTAEKILKINKEILNKHIKSIIGDSPLYVTIDMKAFDKKYSPSVIPPTSNGLTPDLVISLLKLIKENIIGLDIVEFNPYIGNTDDEIVSNCKQTRELARLILSKTFDINEKRINVFNEHSKFLIYRPVDQINPHDVGWYILAGIDNGLKEKLLKKISDEEIITIDIDESGESYMVSKTSMHEQNAKSFYIAMTTYDLALFPDEKEKMCFEILKNYN